MPQPESPSTRQAGRPRDETREQAILQAVIEVLAEVGYDRMTMDAVASRAKASKATIYRRWPGKAELVVAALHNRTVFGEPYPDLGDLRAELTVFVRRVVDQIAGIDGSLLCGLATAASTDESLALSMKEHFFDESVSRLDEVVQRAKARGELGPSASSTVLFEVIPAVAVMHSLKLEPFDEEYLTHLVDDIALPLVSHH